MNLSHRFLQLGKTASHKIDQALPGFGLIGLVYLAADMELASKGLGSPFSQQFWQQYQAQLAQGDLYRYAGTVYIAAASTTMVLGWAAKKIAAAKEYSQMVLGTVAGIGGMVLLAGAIQNHDVATGLSALALIGSNGLLLSGTKIGEKIIDPVVNSFKRRVANFNTGNAMATGFAFGALPMLVDAIRHYDVGFGVVAGMWAGAGLLARRQMKNQPVPNPAITH